MVGGRVGRAVASKVPLPEGVEVAIDDALDKAISVQHGAVLKYIARAQRKNPALTPFQLVERLEKRYQASVISIGAVSGGASAAPGVGTVASMATSVVEISAFVEATALFALARAEVQGVTVTDIATRRALVLAVLLGESGVKALEQAGGMTTGTWSAALRHGVPRESLSQINKTLMKHLVTRFAGSQGALVLGRALPLGIGAAIGGAGNYAVARGAINASRRLFGPPPYDFPPQVVEVVGIPVDGARPAVPRY